MTEPRYRTTSFRIEYELYEQFKDLVEGDDRSVTQMIVKLIRNHVEEGYGLKTKRVKKKE